MKNLLKKIKYLILGGRIKEIERIELTTGLICVHTIDKVTKRVRVEVEKVYN
jgi:hypothetical protein